MTELFGDIAHRMPLQLVEPVEKMINRDVRYRPNAQLFMIVSMSNKYRMCNFELSTFL